MAEPAVPPAVAEVPPVLVTPPTPTPPVDELAPPIRPDCVELLVPLVAVILVVDVSEPPEQAIASGLKMASRNETVLLICGRIASPVGELVAAYL